MRFWKRLENLLNLKYAGVISIIVYIGNVCVCVCVCVCVRTLIGTGKSTATTKASAQSHTRTTETVLDPKINFAREWKYLVSHITPVHLYFHMQIQYRCEFTESNAGASQIESYIIFFAHTHTSLSPNRT